MPHWLTTLTLRWGLTSRKLYRYCVNCGLSVGQCQDLSFSHWCHLSSFRGWTTTIRHSPTFRHISSWLQSVMNAAARLIFSSSRFQHITPLLRQLHWLKAPERIAFKQAVPMYKCLHGSAPAYLTDELCQVADVEARQWLRSSSSSSLIVSRTRLLTISDRAFLVAAARVWNSLPDLVTSAPSVAVFRSRLKTHLFNISYPCDCTVPARSDTTLCPQKNMWLHFLVTCFLGHSVVALDTIIVLAYLLTNDSIKFPIDDTLYETARVSLNYLHTSAWLSYLGMFYGFADDSMLRKS